MVMVGFTCFSLPISLQLVLGENKLVYLSHRENQFYSLGPIRIQVMFLTILATGCSALVDHLTHNPKLAGLNPAFAGTGRK